MCTSCTAPEWTNHVVLEGQQNQIVNDIMHGQLASVSWVIPNGNTSDHPATQATASWCVDRKCDWHEQYWKDTAIISPGMTGEAGTITLPPPKIFNSMNTDPGATYRGIAICAAAPHFARDPRFRQRS